MFGELGDSDIYENNRGGSFEEPSDSDTNFTFDAQNDVNASVSDDFLDTYDSDESYAGPSSEDMQSGLLGGISEQDAFAQGVPSADSQNFQEQSQVRSSNGQQKSSGLIYILILVLLFAGAVGMFFYKRNAEQASMPPENQAMGDYFYDKAADGAQKNEPQGAQNESMATVDVDLAPANETNAAAIPAKADVSKTEPAVKEEKSMNAIERAMVKKKADEAKEKQLGLKTTASSVVIPVSSGGRTDPFLPYGTQLASANKPKFDIVAPPLEIPEADPMIDKLMDFKITGIMFDNIRPSAILTVDGDEQLVHKGDNVMGYHILNITKNKVVVKYKTNVYEVSAGQSLKPEGVNLNPVSSISKQFGGAYSNTPKNIIQFN